MHKNILMGRNISMSGKFLAFAVATGLLLAASVSAQVKPNWLLTFTVTDKGSHIIGSPSAPHKIVEYLSYTCGHCAEFEATQSPAFKAQYVATGKANLEIRNYVLNPIDLTAAMLARCGGKGRFFGNQKHLMATQPVWLGKTKNISAVTQAKLKTGDYVGFMTGVYSEIGLGPIMRQRGIGTAQAKACLADKAALDSVIAMTDAGSALGVQGTPTFLVNGKLEEHVHSLADLKAKLN